MSSEVRISAKGIGKVYELHANPLGTLGGVLRGTHAARQTWALRDVSLEAHPGDFIGILGRNGAGKSTLLEIIAGTRTPSTGSLEVGGRVTALLELGAGFNPDFTGRENARLCAAAYGLDERKTEDRMPSILEFAGIGDFADRPTREYSSGMFARLAFAVCIHCDADILIIDEILGVGDVRFRQKSMRFLREFAKNRIVLFVSHNEGAVLALCNRAIWIDGGVVAASGTPKEVVHAYHTATARSIAGEVDFEVTGHLTSSDEASADEPEARDETPWHDFDSTPAPSRPGLIAGAELRHGGKPAGVLSGGETHTLEIDASGPGTGDYAAFVLRDSLGQILAYRDSIGAETGEGAEPGRPTRVCFEFAIPYLPSGSYAIDIAFCAPDQTPLECLDRKDLAVTFEVVSRHISAGLANVQLLEASIAVMDEGA